MKVDMTHLYLWFDLSYAAEMHFDDNRLNFTVFRIVGREAGRPLYQLKGEDLDSTTEERDKAVHYFEGSMEVDGCVNAEFNQEPMLVHFCSMDHLQRFNAMTVRLYKTAAKLLKESI